MRNPLSRQNSVVSQLSSEMVSSGDSGGEEQEAADMQQRRESKISHVSGEEEELKCSDCGSMSFKAVKNADGGQKLKCTRCGKSV
jgi:hypothetical protein